MPKNIVTDPITDQEMAFALLLMSETMTDRRAAEAVGLNPDTAAYTKAKPRVRAFMLEHRAAVREKLVDQEVDGLRKLHIGRDQILDRLWELATLSHEATRGTIAGQIKALSMIVAIEGLVPDRRFSQPAAPSVEPDIPDWLPKQQHESATEKPGDPIAATKTQPAVPQVPHPEPAPKSANGSSFPNFAPKPTGPFNPFIKPEAQNRVPTVPGIIYDAVLDPINPMRLSFSPNDARGGAVKAIKRSNFIEFYEISRKTLRGDAPGSLGNRAVPGLFLNEELSQTT